MTVNRLHLAIAAGLLALTALECVHVYPELPDPMASNFGGDGAPGGWSSKRSFMIIYAISMGFWVAMLSLAPLLAARARQDFSRETRLWLRDTVGWFAIASLAFSAVVVHWVFEANLRTGRLSGAFVWLLAIYLAYATWWTVRLIRRHRSG